MSVLGTQQADARHRTSPKGSLEVFVLGHACVFVFAEQGWDHHESGWWRPTEIGSSSLFQRRITCGCNLCAKRVLRLEDWFTVFFLHFMRSMNLKKLWFGWRVILAPHCNLWDLWTCRDVSAKAFFKHRMLLGLLFQMAWQLSWQSFVSSVCCSRCWLKVLELRLWNCAVQNIWTWGKSVKFRRFHTLVWLLRCRVLERCCLHPTVEELFVPTMGSMHRLLVEVEVRFACRTQSN